jgi:SAM-dependent methyltransferase
MPFEDNHFDIAFDKGTVDALMCDQQCLGSIGGTLKEVHRVLKPGGLFIEITYGWPSSRMWLWESFELDWVLHRPIRIRNEGQRGWSWIYVFEKIPKGTHSSLVLPENETWPDGPQPPEVPAGPQVPTGPGFFK